MPDIIEIRVQDAGDNVLLRIYELGAGGTVVHLADLVLVVDRGVHVDDPVTGVNIIYLPAAWTGKRIRVFRNGYYYATRKYTRLSNGIQLLGADVCETDEEFAFVNY